MGIILHPPTDTARKKQLCQKLRPDLQVSPFPFPDSPKQIVNVIAQEYENDACASHRPRLADRQQRRRHISPADVVAPSRWQRRHVLIIRWRFLRP